MLAEEAEAEAGLLEDLRGESLDGLDGLHENAGFDADRGGLEGKPAFGAQRKLAGADGRLCRQDKLSLVA